MTDQWRLFWFQTIAHGSLFSMFFWAELWQWLVAIFVYFLTGCLGMTVTFHRLLAHKSWKSPRWFTVLGTLLGTIGGVSSSLGWCVGWCAVHREHHRYTDKPGDPHSPAREPWWKVQWFSMFYHVKLKY